MNNKISSVNKILKELPNIKPLNIKPPNKPSINSLNKLLNNNIKNVNVPKVNVPKVNVPKVNVPKVNAPKYSSTAIPLNNSVSKSYNIPSFIKIIIIVLILLMILYFCYVFIYDYSNTYNNSPYLIETISDGTQTKIIEGNKIPLSSDGRYGREFSYSFWIYIKNSNYGYTTATDCQSNKSGLKHIFHKGSSGIDTTCAVDSSESTEIKKNYNNLPVLQYPGVWLDSEKNDLVFNVNTQNTPNNYDIRLTNIPIDKWVHITFILINNNIDLYVNCNLKRRYTLDSVPKINYGNFFISNYGGFLGYLSKLRYYNYALEPFAIMNLCKVMPDNVSKLQTDKEVNIPYLADDYWFNISGTTNEPDTNPDTDPDTNPDTDPDTDP
tara:strand:- start:294 stop:1436 length:1143 start_codon:yes stop_codon:yes gene_type:complete